MTENSAAIFALCSRLDGNDEINPLEPAEWGNLAARLFAAKLEPQSLFEFCEKDYIERLDYNAEAAARFIELLKRSAILTFELQRLSEIGIKVVTRADKEYPTKLKKSLDNAVPPIFYAAGELELLDYKSIGFVGSRSVGVEDINFTETLAVGCVENGFSIVSGGARGIDSVATETALQNGGYAIEYLSDSLIKKIKNGFLSGKIREGKLLLLSYVNPSAGFNTGVAMSRNRFIYAQSEATVVVKSDYEKGGTWSGATENLKNGWATEYCWKNAKYKGNARLIEMGAIPISGISDIDVDRDKPTKHTANKQLSLFD